MQCAFNGKRIVVFSGGEAKDTEGILEEIKQIRDGGGSGSIIGRNSFQRAKPEALSAPGRGDQDLPRLSVTTDGTGRGSSLTEVGVRLFFSAQRRATPISSRSV